MLKFLLVAVFVAGGVGIDPRMSMLTETVSAGNEEGLEVRFLY